MSNSLRVVPEDLHLSASTVDMHADDMRAKHGAADGRVEESIAGLPAGAAAALGSKLAEWQAATGVLYGNMAGHSDGLRMGALNYAQTDETSTNNITNVGGQISEAGL